MRDMLILLACGCFSGAIAFGSIWLGRLNRERATINRRLGL